MGNGGRKDLGSITKGDIGMTTTTNLQLKKPEQSDGINIADINGNMDTLDLAIKGIKDSFTAEGKAKDADRLGGVEPAGYATSNHNHSGVYAPATHSHSPAQAGATPAAHGQDGSIHVTAADKSNWNSKVAGAHVSDTVLHTTQAEKNRWNGGANAWVATSVQMIDNEYGYNLGIPNFVFTEGCSVTFKALLQTKGNAYTHVTIAGRGFALRTLQKQVVDVESWAVGAWVTVTLSSEVIKLSAGADQDGRGGTAFFKAGGASTPKFPTYTGAHALFGTEKKGYMEVYGSGTLTAQANMNVEAFLVGGGGGGANGGQYSCGGGGGGGGYVKLLTNVAITNGISYPSVIGGGGSCVSGYTAPTSGGSTTVFDNMAAGGFGGYSGISSIKRCGGGDGGSGGGAGGGSRESGEDVYDYIAGNGGANSGAGGGSSYGGAGGAGGGVSTAFNGKTYSGGGGGGDSGAGIGYGNNGSANGGRYNEVAPNATPNTGGGGGGACSRSFSGSMGASGIIIIRWGY